MTDTPPSRRLRLKTALAGALGGAMVLLPLGQALRGQVTEIELLRAERAQLDPMTQALSLQRSLMGHRDVADRVLRGRQTLEPERRLRQQQVDAELSALHDTLSAGAWVKALTETSDLAQDWHGLARRVVLRQIGNADSTQAHQLLLEQSVQVMDLVSASAPAGSFAQLAALQARAASPSPLAPEQIDALQASLQAHGLRLAERQASLQVQRAASGVALAGLFSLALAGALLLRAAPRRQRAADDPGPDRGARLGHGRRRTDAPAPQNGAQQVMDRLRARADSTTAEPPAEPPRG